MMREALESADKSNWQPKKQIPCLFMMLALIAVSLLRGSGKEPSLIGCSRCSLMDWSLLVMLVIIGLVIIAVTFPMLLRE